MTVYEPRGEYQVLVEAIEPKGAGALQVAFEQLKAKLAEEGVFDQSRKRQLPFFPFTIGIVTSLSGAAIRDILTILHRRCPVMKVIIYPVPVQGEGAAERIAQAIQTVNQQGEVEVLIVSRGGGSWEDLWCFNEEIVVRAIAESSVPVISAVGHEVDFTLADFAADYRAATPSAAAETVAPVLSEIKETLSIHLDRLRYGMLHQLQILRHRIQLAQGRCPDPVHLLQRHVQRVDELHHRIRRAIGFVSSAWRPRLHSLQVSLKAHSPLEWIRRSTLMILQIRDRMQVGVDSQLFIRRQRIRHLITSLEDLSPLATLARGYSIMQLVPGGEVVRTVRNVRVGTHLQARVADGRLSCLVEGVQPDESHLDL